VRPIVGAEVTMAGAPPLLLLVEDRRGYQNLCRLITRMNEGPDKRKGEAMATAALCAEHAAGLIALAGAAPRDELQPLIEGIGVCATTDAPYPTPAQGRTYDVLPCARAGATVDEIGRRLPPNGERWLKPPDQMAALFRDRRAAVRATRAIAERCAFTLADLG